MAAKIRKGDLVEVVAGAFRDKDNPTRGRVIRVQSSKNRVWIEKVNLVKRHRKGVRGQSEGQIVTKEAPIDISNVMLVDPEKNIPTRVGFKMIFDVSEEERTRLQQEGKAVKPKKVRYAKKSGAILD
jgi:large subunit ribosomal protein L24